MAASDATIANIKIMIQTFFLTRYDPMPVDYFQLVGAIMAELEPDNEGWQVMADYERALAINVKSEFDKAIFRVKRGR